MTQVLIRTPAVAEWLEYHNAESCPQEGSTCVACAMWLTRCQVFGGFQGDEGKFSVLARRRRHVDEVFHGSEQHCVIEFFDKFCDRARIAEISAGRFGYWGGLQIENPKATHVDRIFGFVLETRRRCTVCQLVRSWFASERVLRIEPAGVDGGPLTVAEMYYRSCALSEIDVECPVCAKFTKHECQSRMRSAPNVLVVQVKRGDGTRRAVDAEVQLDMLDLAPLELVGVVYHNGRTTKSGHYTCLCRGPGGRFWFYDDNQPVHPMDKDVAHIKPREVYMLVYCRRDGSANWARADDPAEVVNIDVPDGNGNDGVARTV